AQPFNRTFTQPGSPGMAAPAAKGGFFNGGRGLLGGLAAGFLGAGLLGMLFGGGMFGGLGGLSSIFGLILQIGLIVIVVRLAMRWWQRRHETASAYAGVAPPAAQSSFRTATGFGLGSSSAAQIGNFRRSSRPDRLRSENHARRCGSFRGVFSFPPACVKLFRAVAGPE